MGVHDGHRQRMKEEFLARPDSFPDHKILELLLFYANPRSDTNETAHILMDRFGSIAGVLDADLDEITKVEKIGTHAAVLFKTVKELSRRYLSDRSSVTDLIRSSKDVYHILQPYFFGAKNEMVYVLCMDGKQKLLGVRKVGEGDVNSVLMIPRKVAGAALSLNAAYVILAHNHVSGLALPSADDRAVTERLQKMLLTVGIQLLDHVILVNDDMVSLRDSGLFVPEDIDPSKYGSL